MRDGSSVPECCLLTEDVPSVKVHSRRCRYPTFPNGDDFIPDMRAAEETYLFS
jgi:hypothetical protein